MVIYTFANKKSYENYEEKKNVLMKNLNENMKILNELESWKYLEKLGVEHLVVVMRALLVEASPVDLRKNVFKFFRYLLLN